MLATATTARPGAPRWAEVTVYRLQSGQYVVYRVGRSTVAHRPDCLRVDSRRMRVWLEAEDEGRVRRVPCLECQPAVGNSMDPHTMLECSMHRVLQAWSPSTLAQILLEGVGRKGAQDPRHLQGMTAELVHQLRQADENFQFWWQANYRR